MAGAEVAEEKFMERRTIQQLAVLILTNSLIVFNIDTIIKNESRRKWFLYLLLNVVANQKEIKFQHFGNSGRLIAHHQPIKSDQPPAHLLSIG